MCLHRLARPRIRDRERLREPELADFPGENLHRGPAAHQGIAPEEGDGNGGDVGGGGDSRRHELLSDTHHARLPARDESRVGEERGFRVLERIEQAGDRDPLPAAHLQRIEPQAELSVPAEPAAPPGNHDAPHRAKVRWNDHAGITYDRTHRLHEHGRADRVLAARDTLHEANRDVRARRNHRVPGQDSEQHREQGLHRAARIRSTLLSSTSAVSEGENASNVTALALGQRLAACAANASISSVGSAGAIHGPRRSASSSTPATWSSTTYSSGNSLSQCSGFISW